MKKEGNQFKITDYKNKKKLNQFKEENKTKNELHQNVKPKPKKINVSGWITKSKVPPKTVDPVYHNRFINSIFKKKNNATITEDVEYEEVNASNFSEVQSNGMRSEIVPSIEPTIVSQSSEWETISKEEEEKTHPNDSQGYVLETGGYAVDLETKEIIVGEPVTANFGCLEDQFSEMNLSAKSYQFDTVKLNDSDLESPVTLGRKRKLHEMISESEEVAKVVATEYKTKRNRPFDLSDSLMNHPPTEKSVKFEKKLKFTPEDIASFKKEE